MSSLKAVTLLHRKLYDYADPSVFFYASHDPSLRLAGAYAERLTFRFGSTMSPVSFSVKYAKAIQINSGVHSCVFAPEALPDGFKNQDHF